MNAVQLNRCKSNNNDFRLLIQELDAELSSRYGELQKQYNIHNQVELIDTVIVASVNQIPVGCGCFKRLDHQSAEIKRMFVTNEYRGHGIARNILSALEEWAKELGFKQSFLETGIKQFEAIGLYKKAGYVTTENYGQYAGNTNSVCMTKKIE